MGVGLNIRKLRERLGYSQTELAKKIDVSKQTLYKYENEIITNIPASKISAIADACHVSPGEIMGWEEKPEAPDFKPEYGELLEMYSQCDEVQKQRILAYMSGLLGR